MALLDKRVVRRVEYEIEVGLFTQDVARLIQDRMSYGRFTSAEVARSLYVSRETLCARLRRHGTTYSRLFATARRELVMRLLADPDKSIGECAWRAGFSSSSALSNWCRRVIGVTPSELQIRLSNDHEARRVGQWRARREGRRA